MMLNFYNSYFFIFLGFIRFLPSVLFPFLASVFLLWFPCLCFFLFFSTLTLSTSFFFVLSSFPSFFNFAFLLLLALPLYFCPFLSLYLFYGPFYYIFRFFSFLPPFSSLFTYFHFATQRQPLSFSFVFPFALTVFVRFALCHFQVPSFAWRYGVGLRKIKLYFNSRSLNCDFPDFLF